MFLKGAAKFLAAPFFNINAIHFLIELIQLEKFRQLLSECQKNLCANNRQSGGDVFCEHS